MALTEKEKQKIIDEENFRRQLKKNEKLDAPEMVEATFLLIVVLGCIAYVSMIFYNML